MITIFGNMAYQNGNSVRTVKRRKRLSGRSARVRVPGSERTEAILRSARKLFLMHGYAGVSIEMIVAESGGSNRDLYLEFENKESLFRRVVEEICQEVIEAMRAISFTAQGKTLSTEEAIFHLGQTFLNAILSARALALHRLIVSNAVRFPELPKLWMKMGPENVYGAVGTFFREYFSAEGVTIEEPSVLARLFLDMITADLQLRALTGGKISRGEIDSRVRRAASIFTAGVRQTSKAVIA
jgi:AcrR family transcriptional regulator